MNRVSWSKGLYVVTVFFCVVLSLACRESSAATVYKVGPRDILNISIFAGGEEQLNVNLTISDEGMINVPFIGPLKAGGYSTSSLEATVRTPLEQDFFVDPEVHIQVQEYHSLQYSISGAVKTPGKYVMQSATTIMDLIAKAGGVVAGRSNVAYILRESTQELQEQQNIEPIKVNLTKLLDEGDMSHNLGLESGDAIYIPLAKGLKQSDSKVYVAGKVKNPGLHDYQPGLTALSVCIMAGGFDKFAAPNRATIVRMGDGEQEVIKINLDEVVEGKIADIPLQPGDRLHIPESWL